MGKAIVLAVFAMLLVCGCESTPKTEPPVQRETVDEARIDKLIGMLKERAASTRESAAIELGDIGDERAVPALIEALGDENIVSPAAVSWEMVLANYRATITGALSKITGQNFGPDHARWKEWYERKK